jgi:hypothetical protein
MKRRLVVRVPITSFADANTDGEYIDQIVWGEDPFAHRLIFTALVSAAANAY